MSLHPNDYIMLVLLALAVSFDLVWKKIPNYITLPVIGWGLLSHTIFGRLDGFLFSFYGLLLGAGIFFIPFVLGWLGGGDVKLMAAVGALQGAAFVCHAALFTAVCGGILAVFYLLAAGKLRPVLKKMLGAILQGLSFILDLKLRYPFFARRAALWQQSTGEGQINSPAMPYGMAIALGSLFAWAGVITFF